MFLRQSVLIAGVASILVAIVSAGEGAKTAADETTVGSRIFVFLDKNGDKRVGGAEIVRIPVTMKSWLNKQGILKKTGFSRTEFLANSAKMLTDLRRSRVQRLTPSPRTPTVRTPLAVPKKTAPFPSPQRRLYAAGATADLQNGEMPVTVSAATANLPGEFSQCDLNRDGQIDFFEWRKCKRAEMARFYNLDKNRDAVLSRAEITDTDKPLTASTAEPVHSSSSSQTIRSASTSKSSSAGSSLTKISAERMGDLKFYFDAMDRNKNKRIDPSEWSISKRITPAFKKARINIRKPMNFEQFTASYQKVFPEDDRSRNDRK